MPLKRRFRRAGAERRAAEAGRALLAFLEGLKPGVELIRSTGDPDAKRAMLGELAADLVVTAKVIETFKSQLTTAESLHRQISRDFADLRRSIGSPISPETGRTIRGGDLPQPFPEIRKEIRVAPAVALEKPPASPRRGPVVDWDSVGASVIGALQSLGGSATLVEIFQYLGLPASRVKGGLLRLERQGAVRRTGTRRSTRYHLSTEDEST